MPGRPEFVNYPDSGLEDPAAAEIYVIHNVFKTIYAVFALSGLPT
jgi:hypothetical protein